jgi:septal ring-binding cell division protein DamX
MYDGLTQALSKGVQQAVANLGHEGGYLNNLDVKIPVPDSLKRVQQAAHVVGQDKVVDEFIATMNHAAEQAVPEAAAIFGDAITKMNVDDAKAILAGPDDAATQYFRKTSETQLTEKMLPIVKQATEKTGVTAAYKQLMQHGSSISQFMGQSNSVDLDGYVTSKALDGLFKMVAAEEKNIRQNPVARSTDLLKKVFGAKLQ